MGVSLIRAAVNTFAERNWNGSVADLLLLMSIIKKYAAGTVQEGVKITNVRSRIYPFACSYLFVIIDALIFCTNLL